MRSPCSQEQPNTLILNCSPGRCRVVKAERMQRTCVAMWHQFDPKALPDLCDPAQPWVVDAKHPRKGVSCQRLKHTCNTDLNIVLYHLKCAMCSEPPTDLLDLFLVLCCAWVTCSCSCFSSWNIHKRVVGQLEPEVSRTVYEKDPDFTLRTVIWTCLPVRIFYFKCQCCQAVWKVWLLFSDLLLTLLLCLFFTFPHVYIPLQFAPANQIRLWNGCWQLSLSPFRVHFQSLHYRQILTLFFFFFFKEHKDTALILL